MSADITSLQKSDSEINALKHLTPEELAQAKQLAQGLDVRDTPAVMGFGVKPQKELSALIDPVMRAVRTQDVGAAGDLLSDLLTEIKALDGNSLALQAEAKLSNLPAIGPLFSKLQQFLSRYEKLSVKLDRIIAALEKSKHTLLRDIAMLDQLHAQNMLYFRQLLTYIGAGDLKLDALRAEHAALAERARASGDMLDAHNVSDLSRAIARLERRVHDLRLGAMVALQSAPQIRLVQDGDQALAEKIQSSILTTIPLWKQQVAIALALYGQKKGAELQRRITQMTNELLTQNAEMLKQSAASTWREVERGIVDIETLRTVNQKLIETIQESLAIQQEGRAKRMQVEGELEVLQKELKDTLSAVRI